MRKSVRFTVVICICAALFVCAVAPAYASGSAEFQTYTDYFDSSTASVSFSAKVYMLIIDPNGGFQKHNYSSTVKVEDDNLVCLSAGQVRDFLSSVNAFVEEKGVELQNCQISVGVKLDSLYSAHAEGTAFPFAAYQYNLTAFGTNLNFYSLIERNAVSEYSETGQLQYIITYPSPLTGSVSGTAQYTPENTFYFTKSVDKPGASNYFYLNSCTVKMTQDFQQTGNAQDIYNIFIKYDQTGMMVCGWDFALYNVYQYLMPPPETTAPPPWNDVVEPDVTLPPVSSEDQFYTDKTKNLGGDVGNAFNRVPFAKYSQAAVALGGYFKKLFSDVPFIGDLMDVFVAFSVCNILIGGFVVGVRAFATDERSKQHHEASLRARRDYDRQRRIDDFMRDDPPSPEEWYNK